ncbi:MAG: hypothetical protein AMJ92_01475 [candidate division Zixibacteria bacterium SM23_81]|nr:MAG: hypothetical protein AMJ92_01475 [candidate division Zixibacteria bacterium SM23_81]
MRIAYFDCFAGISGDMILGALLDAGLELDSLRQELAKLSLSGWKIQARREQRGGISGTRVEVEVADGQRERALPEVLEILSRSALGDELVNQAKTVFSRLAQAEAKVHGIQPSQVHFHEVGATDALIDVVGAVVGLKLLGVKEIFSSPVRLGRGFLQCHHGTLPVPAPASVELLRDVPLQMSDVEAELVTPTGAAVISTLARAFQNSPPLRIERIGYGVGQRDLKEMPNLLRIFIGQVQGALEYDQMVVLETNIDDMSPELCGPLLEVLFTEGARDAYLTPVVMKKGRPAVVLTVLVPEEKVSTVTETVFRHTTTLGIRAQRVHRSKLPRHMRQVTTRWGPLRAKVSLFDGTERLSPEFEDCFRVAAEHGVPLWEVYQEVRRAWEQGEAEKS